MQAILLLLGLLFPIISWLTFVATIRPSRTTPGKRSSGVYVPFVGPILLDLWLLNNTAASGWMLAIPWIADLGTIMFAIMVPALVAELWRTSRFTRIFVLEGTSANQAARISFHKGGRYVLTKKWGRPPGEAGITAMSEPGAYVQEHADGWENFELTSHTGCVRLIEKREDGYDGIYDVIADPDSPEDCQLGGWMLRVM